MEAFSGPHPRPLTAPLSWKTSGGQVVGGGQELTVPQYYIAGSLAAFPISMVESPVDLFKIKMQVPKVRATTTKITACCYYCRFQMNAPKTIFCSLVQSCFVRLFPLLRKKVGGWRNEKRLLLSTTLRNPRCLPVHASRACLLVNLVPADSLTSL